MDLVEAINALMPSLTHTFTQCARIICDWYESQYDYTIAEPLKIIGGVGKIHISQTTINIMTKLVYKQSYACDYFAAERSAIENEQNR